MSFFQPILQRTGTGADPNVPNFFPDLGPPAPSALAQASFDWHPERGEALLLKFAALDPNGISVLSSDDLRQALVTALFHAEMNAVAAGLAVAIPTDKGPGVVIGSAYAKASQNPTLPGARDYLLTYGNVDRALKETAPANANAVPNLGTATQVLAPLVILALVLVAAAVVVGVAYVSSVYVQSHNDALARVARCQMAADLAAKGLTVPAGMCPPEPAAAGPGSSFGDTLKLFAIAGVLIGGGFLIMSFKSKTE